MVVAKSNRRKRQDRVKTGAKRAEQARRRAKAEREQQTAERYQRLLDPLTSPADVAGILLRQLEYQAGLAAARGERPIDTEWLRTELGLTAPLSERLP